jgi:hypothetical protein
VKRILTGTLLALPLLLASLSTQASAAETPVTPSLHNPIVVARVHRRWVPAHYEGTGRHRHRVAGHWVNR